jgi:hypothetical protein
MDHALAARRLSAALGKKITADDVEYVVGDVVCLGPGKIFILAKSNTVLVDGRTGTWMRNGKILPEGAPTERLDEYSGYVDRSPGPV